MNEFRHDAPAEPGLDVFYIVASVGAQILTPAGALVAMSEAAWDANAFVLDDEACPGVYFASPAPDTPPGDYYATVRRRPDGATVRLPTDPEVGRGVLSWDGTREVRLYSIGQSVNDRLSEDHGDGPWGGVTVQGATSSPAHPAIDGALLVAYCHYPFRQDFALLGLDSVGWTQFVFTVKTSLDIKSDEAAKIAVKVSDPPDPTDGLFRLGGSAVLDAGASPADGAIAVTGVAGDTMLNVRLTAKGMEIPDGDLVWELTRYAGEVKYLCGSGQFTANQVVRRTPEPA